MPVSSQPSPCPAELQNSLRSADPSVSGRILGELERISILKAGLIAFLLAFSVCFVVTYVIRPILHLERPLGGEPYDGYLELALNLAQGNGYVFEAGGHKVFHRPPLFPLLLTPCALLPELLWRLYVAFLNSVLFAGAGGLLLRYARKIFSPRVAIVGWLLFIFNPLLLVACKNAVPAICQVFAFLLMICLTWEFFLKGKNGDISLLFLGGYAAALAAAVLSHGTMLTNAFILLGAIWIRSFRLRRWTLIRGALFTSIFFVLAVSPWTWRNYKVTGMFIPVVGNAGLAYLAGNAHWGITQPACRVDETRHQAEARHMGLPANSYKQLISFYGFTDPETERLVNGRAREHFLNHPLAFARKFVLNAIEYYAPVIYFLYPPDGTYPSTLSLKENVLAAGGRLALGLTIFNLTMVFLAVAGAKVLYRTAESRFVPFSIIVAWLAFAVPYFPFLTFYLGRSYYTLGTFPMISLLAAVFLVHKFTKIRGNELPNSVAQAA